MVWEAVVVGTSRVSPEDGRWRVMPAGRGAPTHASLVATLS